MINYLNSDCRNYMLALLMVLDKMAILQDALKFDKANEEEKKLSALMKRTRTQIFTVVDNVQKRLEPKSAKALARTYANSRILIGPRLEVKKDEHFANWDALMNVCCVGAQAMCDGCPGTDEEMSECILRESFHHFNIPAFRTDVPKKECEYRYDSSQWIEEES